MDLHRVVVTAQRARSCRRPTCIDVASPLLGQSSKPGQFVHIRCSPMWDPLLRRPMSIFRIRPEGVSLMVRAVGDGSEIIAASAVGVELDCSGRSAARSPSTRRPGAWRWSAAATAWRRWWPWRPRRSRRGCEVVLLVGAATAEYVFPADELPTGGRVRRRDGGRLARPSRPRHGAAAPLPRLVGRRLRLRPDADARSGRADRPGRPRSAWPARCARGSRSSSRWSSTWAARWASASAAS